VVQTTVPPNSFDPRRDLRPSLSPHSPFLGADSGARRSVSMFVRSPKPWPKSRTLMVLQISSVLFVGKKATGLKDCRSPRYPSRPAAPHWHQAIQIPIYLERRRNVDKVRRQVPKNRELFAVRDSTARCDDLLTTTVDNADRAGL